MRAVAAAASCIALPAFVTALYSGGHMRGGELLDACSRLRALCCDGAANGGTLTGCAASALGALLAFALSHGLPGGWEEEAAAVDVLMNTWRQRGSWGGTHPAAAKSGAAVGLTSLLGASGLIPGMEETHLGVVQAGRDALPAQLVQVGGQSSSGT